MNTIDITNDRIFAIGLPAAMNADGEYTNHIDWERSVGFTLIHSVFGEIEIVDYHGYGKRNARNVTIRFVETGNEYEVDTGCLISGKIKDREQATVNGVGKVNLKGASVTNRKAYLLWCGILARCYNKNVVGYKSYGARGVYVSDDWLNYSVFEEEIKSLDGYDAWLNNEGYHIDKDKYAVEGKTKCYSKETCCFIPAEENLSLPKS